MGRERIPTDASLRKRAIRALHELAGRCSVGGPLIGDKQLRSRDFYRALGVSLDLYVGPALGMTTEERWRSLVGIELEIFTEAIEERVAIIWADGQWYASVDDRQAQVP